MLRLLHIAATTPRSPKPLLKMYLLYTFKAIPALLTPVILLIGIYTGVMTPTEAGAVAGFYALLVGAFAYRKLKWEGLKDVLKETVKNTGTTALMIGAAASVSYIVAKEQIAADMANIILGITASPVVFLIVINIMFLILGCFIDTSVILLVFVPIVLPLVTALNIDLVQFGVVIVFNMMIGLSTPPFGMLLYITSGISGTPLKAVIKETLPMLAAMIVVLILITYIPDIILFLPRALMGY